MAIVNAIPALWSAALLRAIPEVTVWPGLVTDISEEVAEGGDRVNLSQVTGTITVRDYTNAPIGAPERPDDARRVLSLDKQKYVNVTLPDVERMQARGAVFEEWARQAMEKLAVQIDVDVEATFNAGWVDSGAGRNRFTIAALAANADAAMRATYRATIVAGCFGIVERMDKARWMGDRYMVISPQTKAHLVDYLVIDKSTFGTGARPDEALLNASIGNLFGCTVVMDPNLGDVAAANDPIAYFGRRDAVAFAQQMRQMEFYRPENDFADALKALYVYGSVIAFPERKFALVRGS